MTLPVYFFFAILGLVAGGAIVWLLVSAHPFETTEEPWLPPDPVEAAYLADEITRRGHPIDENTVADLLALHLDYLEGRARQNQDDAREVELAKEREAAAEAKATDAGEAADGAGLAADGAAAASPADGASAASPADPAPRGAASK